MRSPTGWCTAGTTWRRLGWAGLTPQADRNASGHGRISTDDSYLAAYVIATDEERLIAREAAGFWVGPD